jgi:hypothetical protein
MNLHEFFAQIIKVVKLMYKKGSSRNEKTGYSLVTKNSSGVTQT